MRYWPASIRLPPVHATGLPGCRRRCKGPSINLALLDEPKRKESLRILGGHGDAAGRDRSSHAQARRLCSDLARPLQFPCKADDKSRTLWGIGRGFGNDPLFLTCCRAELVTRILQPRRPRIPTSRGHRLAGRLEPWMWKWASTTRPNYYVYATGLMMVAIVLAILRALAMYIQNYMAAVAAIEASNRMRRAVYHHTFRLGRLAFRALGPSEAVGIFTRQLETLHNGMYTSLTVMLREPIKFVLLLVFALTINVGLAAAFLVFALLVWFVGGQVAVYFRRQERVATRQAADQIALLQESLMMMRLVKCFLMELFNQSRVERQLSRYAYAQLRRYRGESIYRPFLILLGTWRRSCSYVTGLIVLTGRLGVASAITLATKLS